MDLCIRTRITFADLIKKVLHDKNPTYHLDGNNAAYQGVQYNLNNDEALAQLNASNQVDWSTRDIIKHIRDADTIRTVYLTRKAEKVWSNQWNALKEAKYGREVVFTAIYTPTGMPLPRRRPKSVLCHWLFNNHHDYGRINHDWLRQHNVQIELFSKVCQE